MYVQINHYDDDGDIMSILYTEWMYTETLTYWVNIMMYQTHQDVESV